MSQVGEGGKSRFALALTRRLLCEAARLDHGAVTMLIEDANEDSDLEDRARTAILSGRADLVGVPA